jgi:hypothetical protein
MATAAPELSINRTWPGVILWTLAGLWAHEFLPPDGSSGLLLGGLWAALLAWRWNSRAPAGSVAARLAGLCCPAPQPRLSDVAMGWMMGTLWWHADGCLAGVLPAWATVALHLLLMLALGQLATHLHPSWRRGCAAVAFALIAIWPLWATVPSNLLWLCMLLLTVAWACEPAGGLPGRMNCQRATLALCGPVGLWFILSRWPVTGADALLQPLALLALMALALRLFKPSGRLVRIPDPGGRA